MKKLLYRLLPLMSLLCLPVFGAYSPGSARAALHPDETKRVVNTKEMMYMPVLITRPYTIEKVQSIRTGEDLPPFSDYRFSTSVTNFRPGSVTSVTLRGRPGTDGANAIAVLGIGTGPENYEHVGGGYGRYWFEVARRRVHNYYGRRLPGIPFDDAQYLAWISRDIEAVAVGEPVPGLPAVPRGW